MDSPKILVSFLLTICDNTERRHYALLKSFLPKSYRNSLHNLRDFKQIISELWIHKIFNFPNTRLNREENWFFDWNIDQWEKSTKRRILAVFDWKKAIRDIELRLFVFLLNNASVYVMF